jgi:hypothetical protein
MSTTAPSSSSSSSSSSAAVHVTHTQTKTKEGHAIQPGFNAKGHKILSADDIAEIKRLRAAEPDLWGQARLATHFKCSRLMIAKHAPASDERRAIAQRKIAIERDLSLASSPEVRRERRHSWQAQHTAAEHAAWQAKLVSKATNKAAGVLAHQQKVARKIAAAANVHKHGNATAAASVNVAATTTATATAPSAAAKK